VLSGRWVFRVGCASLRMENRLARLGEGRKRERERDRERKGEGERERERERCRVVGLSGCRGVGVFISKQAMIYILRLDLLSRDAHLVIITLPPKSSLGMVNSTNGSPRPLLPLLELAMEDELADSGSVDEAALDLFCAVEGRLRRNIVNGSGCRWMSVEKAKSLFLFLEMTRRTVYSGVNISTFANDVRSSCDRSSRALCVEKDVVYALLLWW
jgi:hypothetical protein